VRPRGLPGVRHSEIAQACGRIEKCVFRGPPGVTNGENSSFVGQLIGAATIFFWVFVTSLIVFFVIKLVLGIRVGEEEEYEGVDLGECGLEAYPEFVTQK